MMDRLENDQDKDLNTDLSLALVSNHFSAAAPRNQLQNEEKKIEFKRPLWWSETREKNVKQEQKNSDRSVNKWKLDEEEDGKNVDSTICNGDGGARKKLKFNEEQTEILEMTMKDSSTITLAQKKDLAAELNVTPRQVGVWFQNRRARTKLKQTEEDYKMLKKCCITLTHENERLKKELQELRSMKPSAAAVAVKPQTTPTECTVTVCSNCESIVDASSPLESDAAKPNIFSDTSETTL